MALPVDKALQAALNDVIEQHFDGALVRVPQVYQQFFTSPGSILKRHWRHRRDIPGDFVSLPRQLWHVGKHWVSQMMPGKKAADASEAVVPQPRPLSGKEQELHRVLYEDLLQLPALEERLLSVLSTHSSSVAECQRLLPSLSDTQRQAVSTFLQQKMHHLTVSREGGRDMLAFFMIGLIGKSVGTDVVFGSAIATGGAIAQSVYLAQQSWWGVLWAKWAGVPTWVTVSGGVGGVLAAVAVAPLLSPIAELAMNRLRGERYLRKLVQEVKENSLHGGRDGFDLAGLMAGYAQIAPDLLVLLKSLVR